MKKSIGILGGMGPMATAELFSKIVSMTKASGDPEHIRIYMDNNPTVPDRTAAILKGGESPVPALRESAEKLCSCGADCIIMSCNTAHYFLPELQKSCPVPILNMPEITAAECKKAYPGKCAGILATSGTIKAGIYQQALEKQGIKYLVPDDKLQNIIMKIIYDDIKAGKKPEDYKEDMDCVFESLRAEGAEVFILGCTELSVAKEELGLNIPFVDSTDALAKAAIEFCGYEIK